MISPEFTFANRAEAGLWFVIGAACAVAGLRRAAGAVRRDTWVAAIVFILFGASDLVETRIGAWWRPWWLFAWKALCVAAFAWLYWRHRGRHRQAST
jgi:hypothetical protein